MVNKKSITLKNPRALASQWPLVPSIVQSLKYLTGNGLHISEIFSVKSHKKQKKCIVPKMPKTTVCVLKYNDSKKKK